MSDAIERITALIKQNRNDEATSLAMDMLDENPNDVTALSLIGTILLREGRRGLAHSVFSRVCKFAPNEPGSWLNYGRSFADKPELWGQTKWCLQKALKLCETRKSSTEKVAALANLAMLYYVQGKYEKAQNLIDEGRLASPTDQNLLVTQGFIHLALGEWKKAWRYYDVMLETGKRDQYSYGDEPEWDGEKGKRIIISGEQGIGDEIMYASCFNEVIADCAETVIECMPQLKNLFQRSFPRATVYGSRWAKEVFWEKDHNPAAHVAMATIPKFYRHLDSDFPGTPYLIPDKDMVASFRALLAEYGSKPKIGIAWTGGTDRTRACLRTRTLEELLPILRHDAVYVSLEYNDRSSEIEDFKEKRGISIVKLPWVTGRKINFDLKAALVSQLDLVITVPTTVSQVAGALGIETWVLVPKYTGWIFARDTYVWASSVKPYKNVPIKDVEKDLSTWLSIHSQTSKPLLLTG